MRRGMGALVAAILVPPGLQAQDRCEFQDVQELSGRASATLEISAGAGSLVITGDDSLRQFEVVATLCASSRDRLEDLSVSLAGDRLDTDYPDWNGSWVRNNYASIDLEVRVPASTSLEVWDSSGSLRVSGTGDVYVEDSSGEMILRNVGSVVVQDGSGGVEIDGVDGDVDVEDGSGSVDIRDVTGDVEVSDGSGGIDIDAVGGTVRIDRMGSGGVSVHDVAGDLIVTDGRRERIRYSDIRGELDLPPARRRGRRSN